ncbi:MAG: hypothetical protein AB7F86_16330 [Bdellovibrionales bacterium]
MTFDLASRPRLQWFKEDSIRPYVFVRPENRIAQPGHRFAINWFERAPLYKNPLQMKEVGFADQILRLETAAFTSSGMPMPRWVFYDCAIVPGFVAGYAIRRESATPEMLKILQPEVGQDWLPVSLFIMIPTMAEKEWVAHNLCSINSLIPREQGFYGLGFLTKAFGLWYANVDVLCGITQWTSPAMRLHTHYGDFEVLTAYTPIHSHATTLTYRMVTDAGEWQRFFTQTQSTAFGDKYQESGFEVDPKDEKSLIGFQRRLEEGSTRYYLNATQIRTQDLDVPLKVYQLR